MCGGVSVVICCFNSVERLRATLEHLARQRVPAGRPWEVIVVDNCSQDGTAEFARSVWPAGTADTLRVVFEGKPGLIHARERGFAAAEHEFISFVDDDNWVCPEWVALVSEIMLAKPEVGALGAFCEAVCEGKAPDWFERFSRSYAVGGMADEAADVTWTKGHLFGAGLTVRKKAWESLWQQGFRPLLSGRKGKSLAAGEDTEICKALRLAGWRLYFDPRLRLQHFIPKRRLEWDYLRRMRRGMGACSIYVDCYSFASAANRFGLSKSIRENWVYQLLAALWVLAQAGRPAWDSKARKLEGSEGAALAEWQVGRLGALWQERGGYNRAIRKIRQAPWVAQKCGQRRIG